MVNPSELDDPAVSGHAWARYRRLMRWMALAALVTTLVSLIILYVLHPDAPIHLFIAAGLGVGFAVLLAAALMSLVFMSNGTGHDAAIDNPLDKEGDWE